MALRETIDTLCLARLGRKPDLENPSGYNDLIQWLKLYDQRPGQIAACDKWAVRELVAGIAGENVLIPAGWPPPQYPCIVKCTHDSGSARAVRTAEEFRSVYPRLKHRLARVYGVDKGEWAYRFVPPRLIAEEVLADGITDFKFHCAHDRIRWVQVIRDRKSGAPKEAIFAPDGRRLELHMDQNMAVDNSPVMPDMEAWRALSDLALKLCAGWRYVRVDLYWARGRAWFGEMTFWPLAGCYKTADETRFGEMLDLDLSYRMEPIVQ